VGETLAAYVLIVYAIIAKSRSADPTALPSHEPRALASARRDYVNAMSGAPTATARCKRTLRGALRHRGLVVVTALLLQIT
jgi:hypothetical protein